MSVELIGFKNVSGKKNRLTFIETIPRELKTTCAVSDFWSKKLLRKNTNTVQISVLQPTRGKIKMSTDIQVPHEDMNTVSI